MDGRQIAVSIGFGLLMGWSLSRVRHERRPIIWSAVAGAVIGVAVWTWAGMNGEDISAGVSLALGLGSMLGSYRILSAIT